MSKALYITTPVKIPTALRTFSLKLTILLLIFGMYGISVIFNRSSSTGREFRAYSVMLSFGTEPLPCSGLYGGSGVLHGLSNEHIILNGLAVIDYILF